LQAMVVRGRTDQNVSVAGLLGGDGGGAGAVLLFVQAGEAAEEDTAACQVPGPGGEQ